MDRLRRASVASAIGPAAAADLAADLERRYADPHRRYHSIEHITEMEVIVDDLLRRVAVSVDQANAVRLAVWFHDAIYDPTASAGVNEEASAELATSALHAVGASPSLAAEVARLIRLTAGHTVDPGDDAGAVLVDADLFVLASTPDRYDRYVSDVRAEYEMVDDAAWRVGRAQVLQRFLDTVPLYRVGPQVWERSARANLARELASLTGR